MKRSEKKIIKKKGFFNHWVDESILYKKSINAFVRFIFINGALDIITRLFFRLIRDIKRLKDIIRF
jgi:hypothetical protein